MSTTSKDLILIAESGSTKCDAVFIDASGREISRMSTMGFNPYFHSSAFIEQQLKEVPEVQKYGSRIHHLYFYGAGCSSPAMNSIIEKGLAPHFSSAVIKVDHDLTACAYATYEGKPEISCILGTGSNSIFFDGKKIREEVPALAFILGDEGSASYIGKKLLTAYFYNKMPVEIRGEFRDHYNISKEKVLENVYTRPNANVYLAGLAPFAKKHIDHPFIWEIVFNGFREFLEIHVYCFKEAREVPVSFVGSVAFHFQDVLREALSHMGLPEGKIIQKPLDGLVDYHLNHLEKNNSHIEL